MWQRYLANVFIALEAILANKLRAGLTALGIIFGVAAVIAMMAVGKGAQQEILEQIKLVGVNNIVIAPVVEQEEEEVTATEVAKPRKFSPGLTLLDARSILDILPEIEAVSPEIQLETSVVHGGMRRSTKVVGVTPDYFDIYNFSLEEGSMFNERQMERGEQVCIIGKSIRTRFFSQTNPVGKYLKCGAHWMRIVGVLEERTVANNSVSRLGIRDFNMDVYIPIQTMLIRYENRALVTQAMLQKAARQGGESQEQKSATNYHQLDRLVVKVADTDVLTPYAEVISRMLARRHYDVIDYEITIPELLLKQQQRTKDIFNLVLGAIAGISLLVGGIGIMNIMLASVLERIREIGLRLSLGARKEDIVLQFLVEATLISLSGGLIGVILGIVLAYTIASVADIPTIVSPASVILSFGVAATVGLIFGIAPARRAAQQDPITSLRYE
ncbi:putative ABC transport system permease protein [Catalinimonas alkaloidigena]|uniref:Putative ABC transport system permease protein n=1 Tax=Catalinimonas alkaloidigena TaxID=1075417 RepID=A0A1G9URY9_9BACT|nr:ABC transporter permease [Catalinimonas alkaloidigena]SDM62662.1 putative ABC transport system permease protein [Catalinimonas alkaloidigena]